jgi:hypothetical protein
MPFLSPLHFATGVLQKGMAFLKGTYLWAFLTINTFQLVGWFNLRKISGFQKD